MRKRITLFTLSLMALLVSGALSGQENEEKSIFGLGVSLFNVNSK